jgi:hypothetical protein
MSQNVYLRNKLKQLTTTISQPQRDASEITWKNMLTANQYLQDPILGQTSVVAFESQTSEMRYAGNPTGYNSTVTRTLYRGGFTNHDGESVVMRAASRAFCGGSNCDTPVSLTNYVTLPSSFWAPTVTVPDLPCKAAYRDGILYTGPQQFDPFRGGTRPVFARNKVWTPSGLGLPANQNNPGNMGYPNVNTPFP